eukprot:CAMPEP_0172384570 /NCGR_PEP_ID=MMETSP1061-20121228/2308_1 /TAXON_ID=37318 /ORGANISM="Pseudo-nitzschia pungens, Strain cf. pungens" /LENGTH=696 /DNA_ID=CAMNT_0013113237 /DNA_START=19 /DNA_END=2106 /DNA_ORIENTATION=+
MNNFSIILLSTFLVAASSETLQASNQEQIRRHRHLSQGTTCKLTIENVLYSNGTSTEKWVCELPREDSKMLGLDYLEIDESESIIKDARPGESTMTVSKAIVDMEDQTFFVPKDAMVKVRNDPHENAVSSAHRKLREMPTTGLYPTLVIRITTANNASPKSDIAKLANDFFEDEGCIKTEFDACSYGKLKIEPFVGKTKTGVDVKNGVVGITIPYDLSTSNSRKYLVSASLQAANDQLGNVFDNDNLGLVVLVLPPGTGNWLGTALTYNKVSYYNDKSASSVAVHMHEIGHNFGLAHSGDGLLEYNDKTGTMGIASMHDDFHRCFNQAKSYQLGWYDDKVKTIDPLSSQSVHDFVLNGVAAYKENDNALVVVRLDQTNFGQDFYIGYNYKSGIHVDTFSDENMVTIVRKDYGAPKEYGTSTRIASLNVGESFIIPTFNGQRDVEIKFRGLANGNDGFRDAFVRVSDIENRPQEDIVEGDCEEYTFEFTTDRYPDDNRYVILDDIIGERIAESPQMKKPVKTYNMKVCLQYGMKYKFVVYDKFEDGICCGMGPGRYRALDSEGNIVFDSNKKKEKFAVKVIHFQVAKKDVGPTLQPSPTISPTKSPTRSPTRSPTTSPTRSPTTSPAGSPTESPTGSPTESPTGLPTESPTGSPTRSPKTSPISSPTGSPTKSPTKSPMKPPSSKPTPAPTASPTRS